MFFPPQQQASPDKLFLVQILQACVTYSTQNNTTRTTRDASEQGYSSILKTIQRFLSIQSCLESLTREGPPLGPLHHYFKNRGQKVPRKVIRIPHGAIKPCTTHLPPGSKSRLHFTSSTYPKYRYTELEFPLHTKIRYIHLPLQKEP